MLGAGVGKTLNAVFADQQSAYFNRNFLGSICHFSSSLVHMELDRVYLFLTSRGCRGGRMRGPGPPMPIEHAESSGRKFLFYGE